MQLEVLNANTKHAIKPVHCSIESQFRQIASFAMDQLGEGVFTCNVNTGLTQDHEWPVETLDARFYDATGNLLYTDTMAYVKRPAITSISPGHVFLRSDTALQQELQVYVQDAEAFEEFDFTVVFLGGEYPLSVTDGGGIFFEYSAVSTGYMPTDLQESYDAMVYL